MGARSLLRYENLRSAYLHSSGVLRLCLLLLGLLRLRVSKRSGNSTKGAADASQNKEDNVVAKRNGHVCARRVMVRTA